jgi:hypothetical protein
MSDGIEVAFGIGEKLAISLQCERAVNDDAAAQYRC